MAEQLADITGVKIGSWQDVKNCVDTGNRTEDGQRIVQMVLANRQVLTMDEGDMPQTRSDTVKPKRKTKAKKAEPEPDTGDAA